MKEREEKHFEREDEELIRKKREIKLNNNQFGQSSRDWHTRSEL